MRRNKGVGSLSQPARQRQEPTTALRRTEKDSRPLPRWIVLSSLTAAIALSFCLSGIKGDEPAHQPKLLWAFQAPENFVAAPIAAKDAVYVSGLGSFNTGVVHSLAIAPGANRRELWSLSAPDLKLPIAGAAAIDDGKLFFGDGMHQTSGSVLHCVQADSGKMVWQFPVTGSLVHLEGSPVVSGQRLYVGGGNAGVVAIDPRRALLEGVERDLSDIQTDLDRRWRKLQAKYEEEKRHDPDFAFPPNPDSLPKPTPKLIWQVGRNEWHVDAPVTLANDRLVIGSAFLETEQQGLRAVICLKASDGKVLWKTPMKFDPWAGPVVISKQVIVGCSSIRFDPTKTSAARGEILALDLENGAIQWRRELAAGILARAAVQGDLAVITATDGRVRAYDLRGGELRWTYDAGASLFAGAAIRGDEVYAADLHGVVHAMALRDGARRWTYQIEENPQAHDSGAVYGTPLVYQDKLIAATCKLNGDNQRRSGVVVCLELK
jgi:outer membrane protein assembly factor BamB